MAAHLETEYGVEVTLERGHSGVYDVVVDGELIFSKDQQGRFPEEGEIDQLMPKPT